ncbi:putative membrane protein [Rhodoligotrophos appendicifer]|uniref:DUF2157 domain-containing protein n=1 Tax=Rhodoligotrophos appendicifer TaxID=987056 RepID=UPI001186251E|nr:DUF2157 domain-containing protein [Rhodoligotrophos appendicifer]
MPGWRHALLVRSYRKRLAADLPQWRAQGWVTEEGAAAILSAAAAERSTLTVSNLVAMLGALLLGLGVITFIAANWEDFPRLVRLIMLVTGLGLAYLIAAILKQRDLPAMADAAVLVAGLVFAAAIALVGQTYHLSGEFRDAVLLWIVGCLGAALLTRSVAATVLSLAGICYWAWEWTVDAGIAPHWPSLAVLVAAGALSVWLNTPMTRKAFIVALLFWLAMTLIAMAEALDWSAAGALSLGAALALCIWSLASLLTAGRLGGRLGDLGEDLVLPVMIALFLAVFFIQFAAEVHDGARLGWQYYAAAAVALGALLSFSASYRGAFNGAHAGLAVAVTASAVAFCWWLADAHRVVDLWPSLAIGVVVLATALWMVGIADSRAGRFAHTAGLVGFGVEVLYLYVVTLGTLIDTALAFLVGGILLIGLSVLLLKMDRWLRAKPGNAAT